MDVYGFLDPDESDGRDYRPNGADGLDDHPARLINIVEGEMDYSRIETLDDVKTTQDAYALLMNDISSLANSGHLDDHEMNSKIRKYRDDRIGLEIRGLNRVYYDVFDSIAYGWLRCDSAEHGDHTQLDILEGRIE